MIDGTERFLRFAVAEGTGFGRLDGETIVELEGDPLLVTPRQTGRTFPLAGVRLLPPTTPSKVIAVGLNYRSHLHGRPQPGQPGLFAKFPSTLIGHGWPIEIPADASEVHYEGEVVVAIGRIARHVSRAEAAACVFGVTAGNDVSERNWQKADLQWIRAKACDSFGPVGPWLATGLDYRDLGIELRVNGQTRQAARTRDLIFGVDELVSFISRYVTLFPGDLIFTGTPGRTAALEPGDEVEVEVEGVGVLSNRVVSAA
jgi:2-keto-4-pentenoate hydratase/2-oxohepta-3-ene-1,7-dioic acid hydratase in catechol pathway